MASSATAVVGSLLADDSGVQLAAVVPEPSVTAMSLLGVTFISFLRRRGSVVKS
jgi:hypothetical protein